MQVLNRKGEKARQETRAKDIIQPLLLEEAKKIPEKIFRIGYLLYVKKYMSYTAIEI